MTEIRSKKTGRVEDRRSGAAPTPKAAPRKATPGPTRAANRAANPGMYPKAPPYRGTGDVPADLRSGYAAQDARRQGFRPKTATDNAGRKLQTGARVLGNPGKRSSIDVGPRKDFVEHTAPRAPRKAPPKATRGKRG